MHRRVVGELCREMIPLAAATHSEDDRIEGLALVYAWTAGTLRGVVLFEDRFDDQPQVVGDAPYSRKRLLLGHWHLFYRGTAKMIPEHKSFEIVT